MPAILRKSLPKYRASITQIRPYAQNDVVVGSGGSVWPPCSKVETACGSATLCLAFGVCGVVCLLEISITDVLGIA